MKPHLTDVFALYLRLIWKDVVGSISESRELLKVTCIYISISPPRGFVVFLQTLRPTFGSKERPSASHLHINFGELLGCYIAVYEIRSRTDQ
jgi:hypothetical protein